MNPQLHNKVTSRLTSDYGFNLDGKAKFLRQGRCPSCNHKELYTNAEHPWVLRCGRLNNCGAEYHIKDIYSDLFNDWSENYKATPENPNAAADAYMRDGRGFKPEMVKGWYRQEYFWDRDRGIGSATVRFDLADGIFWERLIDRPERFGRQKANFRGQYGGMWWAAPGAKLAQAKEIWIVEGVFDCIALMHHNITAVSALTSHNYPTQSLAALAELCKQKDIDRPALVWALDGDRTGRRFTKKHVRQAEEDGWQCSAALIDFGTGSKLDWNDAHQRDRMGAKDIELYRYNGKLLMAKTASEKALLMWRRSGKRSFHLAFDNKLHWFELDMDKYSKALEKIREDATIPEESEQIEAAMKESCMVLTLADCYPTALYFQQNILTDESWYYFRIDFPHDGKSIKNTFTGAQVAGASEFKKRLLSIAPGAVFSGSTQHLDRIMQDMLYGIKTVETIDFVGYVKEHGAYIYADMAVKDGRIYELNEEDFFDLGKLSIKTLSQSTPLTINTNAEDFKQDWVQLLWKSYGAKGIVALAFWMGTLFAEQIRSKHKSFPFLEIIGDPGAGKSTLVEFLWKLMGRADYEGFDPSKSTLAARARNFSQTSNMPVVLIESERGDDKAHANGFDWDELKTAYNGRSVRSRGVKNSGNDTYEPPFRGAIVISQNDAVNASDAVLQRIVHMHFYVASHTQHTKQAAEKLERFAMDECSGFLPRATLKEKAVMDQFNDGLEEIEKVLGAIPDIKNLRIIKNHAQIISLVRCLPLVLDKIEPEYLEAAENEIVDMATDRQRAINADHEVVEKFWEIYDYLNGSDSEPRLNHSRDDDLIAINLNHFIQVASEKKQQIPMLEDLKRHLKTSRRRKFVIIKNVNSIIRDRHNKQLSPVEAVSQSMSETIKCWVFKKPNKGDRDE